MTLERDEESLSRYSFIEVKEYNLTVKPKQYVELTIWTFRFSNLTYLAVRP